MSTARFLRRTLLFSFAFLLTAAVFTACGDKTGSDGDSGKETSRRSVKEDNSNEEVGRPSENTIDYGKGPHALIRMSKYGHSGVFSEEEATNVVELVKRNGGRGLPVLHSHVLLQVGEAIDSQVLMAFDPDAGPADFVLTDEKQRKDVIKDGTFSLDRNKIGVSQVVANEFGLTVGSKALLHSPSRLARLINHINETGKDKTSEEVDLYLPTEYEVSFIFSFDKYDCDRNMVVLSLDDADGLFSLDYGCATDIYVWVDDPSHMDRFLTDLRSQLSQSHPGAIVYSLK